MRDSDIANSIIYNILHSGNENKIVLSGPAGTGKTTFIRYLVKECLNLKKKIAIICPTNKSICNLVNNDDSLSKITKTYASFFKCSFDLLDDDNILKCNIKCCEHRHHDADVNSVIKCMRHKKITGTQLDLLIVEEASMFNHKFYMLLNLYEGIKYILFVGDSNQIPPITDNCPECLNCSFSVFKTDIYSETFKEQKRASSLLSVKLQTLLQEISRLHIITNTRLRNILTKLYDVKTLSDVLPLKAPILTYHVNTAQQINYLLTNSRRELKVGDVATIDKGSIDDIPIGSVVKILDIKRDFYNCIKLERGFNFIVYKVLYENMEYEINVIDPSELSEYKTYCKNLRNTKTLAEKYKINTIVKEHLSELNLAYSLTAHKAQGQTYHTAYVEFEDILTCRDKNMVVQILYSVVSRAKENVFLVKIPDHYKVMDCDIVDKDFCLS